MQSCTAASSDCSDPQWSTERCHHIGISSCGVKHWSVEPLFYTIQPIGFGLRHRQVLATRERSLFCASKSLTESHGHEETTENLRLCASRTLVPNRGSCFICPSLSIVLYGSASLLSSNYLKMLQGKEDQHPSSQKLILLPPTVAVPANPGACQPLAVFPYDEWPHDPPNETQAQKGVCS